MTPLEPMYLVELDRNQAMMTSGSSTHRETRPMSSRGAALLSAANIHSGSATPMLRDCGPSGCPYFS